MSNFKLQQILQANLKFSIKIAKNKSYKEGWIYKYSINLSLFSQKNPLNFGNPKIPL